jgi:hypothetical protein
MLWDRTLAARPRKAGPPMAEHSHLRRSLLIGLCAAALLAAPSVGAAPLDQNGYNGAPTPVSGGPVPTMNGVPCVAGHLGTCTGFAQNQPRPMKPRASVGHSPTVSP